MGPLRCRLGRRRRSGRGERGSGGVEFLVAVAASGDQMNAIPTPMRMNGSSSRQIGVVGSSSTDSQVNPIATAEKPNPTMGRG